MQSLHAPETIHKGPADEPLGSYGDVAYGPYSSEIALNIQCVDPHFIRSLFHYSPRKQRRLEQ